MIIILGDTKMREKINSQNKVQIGIAYLSILLLAVNLFFSTTNLQIINTDTMRYVAIGILLLNFFVVRKVKISIYDIIIVPLCIIYYFIFSQSVALNVLVLYLISFYLRKDDIEHVKTNLLKILVAVNILWGILLLTHILPDQVSTAFGRIRHYLGFKNINQSSLLYFPLLLLLYDRYKDRVVIKVFICMSSIGLFYLTNTRSAFYAFVFFIFITWLFKRTDKVRGIVSRLFLVLISVFTGAFLLAGKIIQIFPVIDQLLTYRASIIARGMDTFTYWNYIVGLNEQLLDNSFVMFFSAFGLMGFIFLLFILRRALVICEFSEWRFIVTALVYGFFESTLFIPEAILAIYFFILLQKSLFNSEVV